MHQKILHLIDARFQDLVRFLQELVRAKSVNPPGNEVNVARVIVPVLQDLGMEVKCYEARPNRPNVVATLGQNGEGRDLICYAHMDTVPAGDECVWRYNPFEATLVGDRIYGRGTCDHKMAIAAFIFALKAILEAGIALKGGLVFVFTSDEETGGAAGIRYLARRKLVAGSCALYGGPTSSSVVGESPGNHNLFYGVSRIRKFRVRVSGRACHPAFIKPGMDIISLTTDVIRELVSFPGKQEMADFPSSCIYIETLQSTSDGPAQACELGVLEINHPSMPELVDVEQRLTRIREKITNVNFTYQLLLKQQGALLSPNHYLIKTIYRSSKVITGKTPRLGILPSVSDMDCLMNDLNLPTVMFGYGSLENCHIVNESISIVELLNTCKVYARTMSELLSR